MDITQSCDCIGRWKPVSGMGRDLIIEPSKTAGQLTWHIDGRMGNYPYMLSDKVAPIGASFVLDGKFLEMFENGMRIERFTR